MAATSPSPAARGEAPYRELGRLAATQAGKEFALGTTGAGFGATTKTLKGGLGSASAIGPATGQVVGALVAVNAVGTATIGDGPHFWAAPYEQAGEFGAPRLAGGRFAAGGPRPCASRAVPAPTPPSLWSRPTRC
jgi:L-aminopeptidase/D-esterase-like protein